MWVRVRMAWRGPGQDRKGQALTIFTRGADHPGLRVLRPGRGLV